MGQSNPKQVKDNTTPTVGEPDKRRRRFRILKRVLEIGAAVAGLTGLTAFGLIFFLGDRWQAQRKYRVLVPLYAGNQEYLDFIGKYNGRFPISEFQRKVSIDTLYALEAGKSAWFRQYPQDKNLKSENFDFYYFPEGYDEPSYKAAFEKAMSVADEEDVEVIAAIGHVTSTATKAYASFYGKQRLPLIMPMATATDLTNYLRGTWRVPAILRLVPTNAKQSELLSSFLLNNGAYRVIIAKDLSNPAYSGDLVEGFRTHFVTQPFEIQRKKKPADNRPMFLVNHGEIVAVIPAGGESGAPVTYPEIKEMTSDAFVMIGMTNFSLETLAQARASSVNAKFTVFTDGAIDEDLLPRVNSLLSDANKNRRIIRDRIPVKGIIYISFPLDEPMPKQLEEKIFNQFHEWGGPPRNLAMTHSLYVVDAAQIVLQLIKGSVADQGYSLFASARGAVADKIEEWNKKNVTSENFSTYDPQRKYKLDTSGNALNIEYHLYRASLPGVTERDIKEFADDKTKGYAIKRWASIAWVHDEACPAPSHKKDKTTEENPRIR